ncbi:Membrane metallo-endopeptidase-like 1 [Liparis tanakae]|uniref:Membrane metallo-endopeptidase-like 1 n=1 Tax=Liparis tanakae TaxID=230148 RepID=A0A4Z2HK75_9TELE|nr:Membrane metallo-endopeptidase-like 1 [Liparis tanakae]
MNESLIEQRDSQPLLKLIESIGDWPVASDAWNATTEEAWSLEDTLAKLTARFHKKVLLDMYVWTDDRDSRRHIIYVRSQRTKNSHNVLIQSDFPPCGSQLTPIHYTEHVHF